MNLCSFSPGNRVVLHSRVYTVASFNDEADRVTLVSEDDGSERQIEVGKAFLEYLQGNLKLEHARRVVPREKCTPRTRLHWINASRLNRAIAETRRRLVQFLDARGINLKDKDALKAAIADFEKEDEERREREAERADIAVRHLRLKASRPTIMRWKRGLRAHHGHAQGVLPATEYRGNGESRLSEDLESIVQLCLDNDYLVPGGTIAGAYDDLKVRINAHNARATADKQLRIPSLPTFRRRVHKIDPRESHAARYGGKAAAYLFRTSHRRPRLSDAQFMHVWQMDHATLDVLVKSDRTGLLLGRPRITAIIELVSRAIVGLTIGFQTTSTDTALECLRMAILPKDQEWLKSMGIQEHWPCHGVPLVLVLDNGAEFHSESFRSACALLGIDIEYCGTRMPWQKGAIERFIRTLNTQC
jgi:putative transposase